MKTKSHYKVLTKGNIVVNDIKVGDIHYEFGYGCGIKCEVISEPRRNKDGQWIWQSKNLKSNEVINYMVSEGFEHYGPNLYDYEAYTGMKYV